VNVVVQPEGTAELDERPTGQVASEAFDQAPSSLNLFRDGVFVGRAVTRFAVGEEVNRLAMDLVAHLNGGAYVKFEGTVILADLSTEQAVELLELAKETEGP
jgi:NOL1/NOP2/fmu family ribosome biogenesis protein